MKAEEGTSTTRKIQAVKPTRVFPQDELKWDGWVIIDMMKRTKFPRQS